MMKAPFVRRAAFAALVSFAAPAALAEGYADDFISTDDATVRCLTVGTRRVYVFTNATATVSVLKPMTLRDALLVGGGGGGGNTVGGGGGGGGVVALTTPMLALAGDTLSVVVGAGGVPLAADNWNQSGGGGASSLTVSGALVGTAFGGGGGGGYNCSKFTEGSWGSAGGGGGWSNPDVVEGFHYTASQGNRGGAGKDNIGGGGGGAASAGAKPNGGEGVANAITGADEVYGSGGGGAYRYGPSGYGVGGTNAGDGGTGEGQPGVDGFGGGGGGGTFGETTNENKCYAGGRGGCGTVILSFEEGATAGQPEISDVAITYPYGTSQPQANITIGGATSDDVFSATVTVKFGTTADAADCEHVFSGVYNGSVLSFVAPISPAKGATVFVTVTVESRGAETRTRQVSADVTNDPSPYVGRGGGAGVIHVRPGATGTGDGSDWFNACTSLRDAIALLSAERPELWFAGREEAAVSRSTIAPAVAVAIRGGFSGLEMSPEERTPGAKSVCDAKSFNSCFAFANAVPVTLDGFELTQGKSHNLEKTGAGNLTVTNCVIRDTSGSGFGRGVCITSASAATVRFVDVRFANLFGGGTNGKNLGTVLYASGCGRVEVDWCAFTTNGCSFTATGNSLYDQDGAAIYAENAPLTVRRTLFAGNRSQALQGGGGVVRVKGSCGESAFTNCLFVGNEVIHGYQDYTSFSSPKAGMVAFSPTAGSVDVVNCTFAYGAAGVSQGAAGISVYGGEVRVRNCIFYGNTKGTENTASTDFYVDGGTADIAYCLFDDAGEGRVACADGATATVSTETFVYDNPLFATEVAPGDWLLASSLDTGWVRLDSAKLGDICAFNAHLRGSGGYLDERTGEVVKWRQTFSPAIDAGDPKTGCDREARPNGGRVNLGCYGNTPWATRSGGGLVIMIR